MVHKVEFISLEDDAEDLILSFAIPDSQTIVKSLILLRSVFFEQYVPGVEKGVSVSLEGSYFEQEDLNMLESIKISEDRIKIKARFRKYNLDISEIKKTRIKDMLKLLNKLNYDNKFVIETV